ncbi:MAG: hypothetical protein ABH874_04570 [Methanobacteriota archaeon]
MKNVSKKLGVFAGLLILLAIPFSTFYIWMNAGFLNKFAIVFLIAMGILGGLELILFKSNFSTSSRAIVGWTISVFLSAGIFITIFGGTGFFFIPGLLLAIISAIIESIELIKSKKYQSTC